MLMPSIFGENFFDSFFDTPMERYGVRDIMKTDIEEKDQGYELTINMPGCAKEDVQAELKDGYLTIHAVVNKSNDEKDNDGHYIRRERYSGSCSRSFYVGDQVSQEDIKAKFEDGMLKLYVPKKEDKPQVEQKQHIAIEG